MIIPIILFFAAYANAQFGCGICGPDTEIACVSATEFYVCNNNEPDKSELIECPTGSICNSLSVDFCDLIGTVDPECGDINISTTPTTSVSQEATLNPVFLRATADPAQSWCSDNGEVGLFSDPDDTSCTKYYKCFTYQNDLTGASYTCVGKTLFNSTLGQCTSPDTTSCD